MINQLDMFDAAPHARRTDPPTSHEAVASINITAQALRILRSYADGAELLDVDAYRLAGFPPTARDGQRCSDLRHHNLIERLEKRALTPSGKSGYLCRITQAGRDFLQKRGVNNGPDSIHKA